MRILIALTLLIGCGPDPAGLGEALADPPEVARINIDPGSCYITCSAIFSGTATNNYDLDYSSDYDFVLALAEGATAPAACDGSSRLSEINMIQLTDLKASTAYALRGCLYDRKNSTYTAGITSQYTTPAAP